MQEPRSESRDRCRGECGTFGEDKRVPPHARVRAFLESVAKRALKHSGRRRGTGLLARRAVAAIMVSCVDLIEV